MSGETVGGGRGKPAANDNKTGRVHANRHRPLASWEIAATGLPLKFELLAAVNGICHRS